MNKQTLQSFTPLLGLSFLALGASALPATAAPIPVQFTLGSYQTVNLMFNDGVGTETFDYVAAGGYGVQENGSQTSTAVFCTDLFDDVYVGETWDVTVNPTSQLRTQSYAVGPDNINAIDYIAENYTTPATSAANQDAAQLAIWDLAEDGKITDTGGVYSWSNAFSATDTGSNSLSNISDVYQIEQAALAVKTPSGSVWLDPVLNSEQPADAGRPQDFVTYGSGPFQPNATPAPEPGAMSLFACMGVGLMGLLASKRRRMGMQAQ